MSLRSDVSTHGVRSVTTVPCNAPWQTLPRDDDSSGYFTDWQLEQIDVRPPGESSGRVGLDCNGAGRCQAPRSLRLGVDAPFNDSGDPPTTRIWTSL